MTDIFPSLMSKLECPVKMNPLTSGVYGKTQSTSTPFHPSFATLHSVIFDVWLFCFKRRLNRKDNVFQSLGFRIGYWRAVYGLVMSRNDDITIKFPLLENTSTRKCLFEIGVSRSISLTSFERIRKYAMYPDAVLRRFREQSRIDTDRMLWIFILSVDLSFRLIFADLRSADNEWVFFCEIKIRIFLSCPLRWGNYKLQMSTSTWNGRLSCHIMEIIFS